jgi:hypothetical protein
MRKQNDDGNRRGAMRGLILPLAVADRERLRDLSLIREGDAPGDEIVRDK